MREEVLFSVMESSLHKSLQVFNETCDEICDAKYILALGKISKLMRVIASCKPLYKLFDTIVKGYNFVEQFERSKYRDENGMPYLKLPEKAKEQLCFTFCLLFAVDTGKTQLGDVLKLFFKASDVNIEFRKFCEELIVPFKNNVNAVFVGSDVQHTAEKYIVRPSSAPKPSEKDATMQPPIHNEKQAIKVRSFDGKDTDSFYKNDKVKKEDCYNMLRFICEEIEKALHENIEQDEQDEVQMALKAFMQAVNYGEQAAIDIMYIALKNTLRCITNYESVRNCVNNLVKAYNVLKNHSY